STRKRRLPPARTSSPSDFALLLEPNARFLGAKFRGRNPEGFILLMQKQLCTYGETPTQQDASPRARALAWAPCSDHPAGRRDEGLPGWPHGPGPRLALDRPRRVRLPRRPDRLWQVDADQDPDPRARTDRRQHPDRRPRHRPDAGEEDSAASSQHRHGLPG